MSLTVAIQGTYPISDLIQRYPILKKLATTVVSGCEDITWHCQNEVMHDIQVIFIGKTGYGKSSTINKIVGKKLFETSDIQACTKKMYSVEYKLSNENDFFSFNDLPGIGESLQADQEYCEWYRDMLKRSVCVVYVLRADQRDYSLDEALFKEMFKTSAERKKVILALNYADKIEPVNRSEKISSEQIENLQIKVKTIKKLFKTQNVLYYSADNGFNLGKLIEEISKIVLSSPILGYRIMNI